MGTHMVFSATSTSASGDWQCRCRPLAAVVGLRLAALLGLHPHVGLCRPLAALLWCHFPERDTFGRLGAAAVDQGTALAGFARQMSCTPIFTEKNHAALIIIRMAITRHRNFKNPLALGVT